MNDGKNGIAHPQEPLWAECRYPPDTIRALVRDWPPHDPYRSTAEALSAARYFIDASGARLRASGDITQQVAGGLLRVLTQRLSEREAMVVGLRRDNATLSARADARARKADPLRKAAQRLLDLEDNSKRQKIGCEEWDDAYADLSVALADGAARPDKQQGATAHPGASWDDPELDGTDAAHPAWWRGNDHGVDRAVAQMNRLLDEEPQDHIYGARTLTELGRRLNRMREQAQPGASDDWRATDYHCVLCNARLRLGDEWIEDSEGWQCLACSNKAMSEEAQPGADDTPRRVGFDPLRPITGPDGEWGPAFLGCVEEGWHKDQIDGLAAMFGLEVHEVAHDHQMDSTEDDWTFSAEIASHPMEWRFVEGWQHVGCRQTDDDSVVYLFVRPLPPPSEQAKAAVAADQAAVAALKEYAARGPCAAASIWPLDPSEEAVARGGRS